MSQVVTGIDIGTHSIKVAQIKHTGKGIMLTGVGSVPLEDLSNAPDGKRKDAKIGLLLRDLMNESGVRSKFAVTSVPGKRLFYRYVHVPPVPAWKLKALMQYEIEEESDDTSSGDVSYDYRLLDLPTKAAEFTVMVAMAKGEVTDHVIDAMSEASVRVQDIFPGATSLFNAWRNTAEGEVEETSVILDIGADSIDMIIQSFGRFFFTRTLSNAGNAFTEALQQEFELPFREAESLKIERGKILPFDMDDDDEEEEGAARDYDVRISDALSHVADDLANAVQASLMFCRTQLKLPTLKVDKIILCGGGSMVNGLDEYLGARLRYDVEYFDLHGSMQTHKLYGIQEKAMAEGAGRYATAIGLALTGLRRQEDITISLLPEKEKNRRNFHLTDKYLYYGAACVAAALGLSMYASLKMGNDLGNKEKQLHTALEGAKEKAKTTETKLDALARRMDKVDAMHLRANSSSEAFSLLTLLTDPTIVPKQINITEIAFGDLDPIHARRRDNRTDIDTDQPSERLVMVSGLVRTVIPPPVTQEQIETRQLPEPPMENYAEGLRIIEKLNDSLMQTKDVVYRAYVRSANASPAREKAGDALQFSIGIDLAPKTVEARRLFAKLARKGTKEEAK
ncbi:MAG: type IV pilus assembly protein PilM [Planctomycetota bacterium]|jgi:type IV pilus assembly protein PilM|nr:type IV pilus assembly protein PilM [Planctomycetota bacterium]